MKHHAKNTGKESYETLDDLLFMKISKLMDMSTMRCSSTYSHFFPKLTEPTIPLASWDIVLADSKLMKADIYEEKIWKKACSYKFSHEASNKVLSKERGYAPRTDPEEKNEAIPEDIAEDMAVINEELAQLTYDSTKMESLSSFTDKLHFESGTMIESYESLFDTQKDEMRFDDEETTDTNNVLLDYFTPEYHEIQNK